MKEIKQIPLLTAEEERSLAYAIRGGDMLARDRMIRSNLRLVVAIARDYMNRGLSFMDLVEEGNIGLVKGVEHFDPDEGNRFSTYGTWWIKQSIRRALVNSVRPIRVPSYMVELISKFKHARNKLQQHKGGEVPDLYEVAESMQLRPESVEMLRCAMQTIVSTEDLVTEEGRSINDMLVDPGSPNPLDIVLTKDEMIKIDKILESINEREAEILRKRYGIGTDRPMTLKEIGEEIGLTRERVRQIENEALRKLYYELTRNYKGEE